MGSCAFVCRGTDCVVYLCCFLVLGIAMNCSTTKLGGHQIFHTMASEDGVDVESGTYGIWNLMVINVQHQDECQALGA